MNPHGFLTGLGGQRGKVVWRTVYDGALRMEDSPHAIVRDALTDYLLGNAATATAAGGGGEERSDGCDGDGGALAECILATVRHGNDSRRWPILSMGGRLTA
jgi:hypothetical protein